MSERPRGDGALLMISAACFGAAVLPSQWATDSGLSAAAVVSIRFTVATLAVVPSLLRKPVVPVTPVNGGSSGPDRSPDHFSALETAAGTDTNASGAGLRLYLTAWLVSGAANTAGFLLLTEALKHTTAATGAFLSSLSVLVVPLLLAAAHRRRPGSRHTVGIALAVLGSLILTGGLSGGVDLGSGALLALGAALVGSVHIVSVGYFAPRLDVGRYNAGQLAVVALAAALITMLGPGWGKVGLTGLTAAACCGLAQAGGLTLQAIGQKAVDGATAALIFTLVPVVALVSAWLLDGQTPSLGELLGGAAIVAAVLVGERGRRRPAAAEAVRST